LIAVDTNLLARLYVTDPTDPEAARQQAIAARVVREAEAVFVPVTVVLELAWVVRSFYGFEAADFQRIVEHLGALPNVVIEDHERVVEAAAHACQGLDIADALHAARSRHCERLVTFDDRRFARRAAGAGVAIPVVVPE
jgi:predicted nucleic-acid-binding protein